MEGADDEIGRVTRPKHDNGHTANIARPCSSAVGTDRNKLLSCCSPSSSCAKESASSQTRDGWTCTLLPVRVVTMELGRPFTRSSIVEEGSKGELKMVVRWDGETVGGEEGQTEQRETEPQSHRATAP